MASSAGGPHGDLIPNDASTIGSTGQPSAEGTAQQAGGPSVGSADVTAGGAPGPGYTGLRVLAVDDEASARKMLTRLLTGLGCTVDVLDDGETVLQQVQDAVAAGRPYEVALMDITMARVHGDVACRQVRDAGHVQLPIVAASGNTTPQDVERYLSCGFNGVLPKPFSKAGLTQALASVGVGSDASTGLEAGKQGQEGGVKQEGQVSSVPGQATGST